MGGVGSGRHGGKGRMLDELPRLDIVDIAGKGNIYRATFTHEGQEKTQYIRIAATDCGYGGQRHWLVCPVCKRRARVLYQWKGWYICRNCCGLPYASQYQGKRKKLASRKDAILSRLGWTGGWNMGKPRYMRKMKFRALIEELRAIEAALDQ